MCLRLLPTNEGDAGAECAEGLAAYAGGVPSEHVQQRFSGCTGTSAGKPIDGSSMVVRDGEAMLVTMNTTDLHAAWSGAIHQ